MPTSARERTLAKSARPAAVLAAAALAATLAAACADDAAVTAPNTPADAALAPAAAAATTTTTWRAGRAGTYTTSSNWSSGVPSATRSGTIKGRGSVVNFYPSGNDPRLYSPNPAPAGLTVTSGTLNFRTDTSTGLNAPLGAVLSNSTFGPNTVVNGSGDGATNLDAWFANRLNGTVNVAAGGELRLSLQSDWAADGVVPPASNPLPTTTNAGTIAVGADAEFWLRPLTGGTNYVLVWYTTGSQWVLVNPYHGFANFVNTGRITVAPGGDFADRGLSPSDGLYFHDLANNGTISAQGAPGKKTGVVLDANLRGTGSITLDGGAGDPSQTQLALYGPMFSGNVTLRNASMYMHDGTNHVRAKAPATITFAGGKSYLFLYPSGVRGQITGTDFVGTGPSLIEPFGATIQGFQAGNTIAFYYTFPGEFTSPEQFAAQWDQAAHTLTVRSVTLNKVIAQFTLAGTYTTSQFRVSGRILRTGAEVPGYLYAQPPYDALPSQVDITTTHVGP